MKTFLVIISSCIFSLCVMSQDKKIIQKEDPNPNNDTYCSELRDSGMIVIVHGGKEVTRKVELASGITLKLNGVVTKKDGTSFVLKNGECIDSLGNLIQAMGNHIGTEKK